MPASNLASVCVWIVFYLGVAYGSAVLGNVWAFVNPVVAFTQGWRATPRIAYPTWLGCLPAIAIYYVFIWLELLSPNASLPSHTALALVSYYALSLAGAALLGTALWSRAGDFLTLMFGLFSRLSPLEYRAGRVYFRWPVLRLLDDGEVHGTLVFFVLLMFSSTAFDGLRETVVWDRFSERLLASAGTPTEGARRVLETAALVLSPAALLIGFVAALVAAKTLVTTKLSIGALLRRFALTLVPIAFAYHFAHYFTLLAIQGQAAIALASDPFGLGWNLFGTASRAVNATLVSARTVWNVQFAVILLGHVASIYLAHVVALRVFGHGARATRSQLPMLVLMVCYTVLGLWILAQPMNPAQ